MRAFVIKEKCISCGLCVSICPAIFSKDGDRASAMIGLVPTTYEDNVKKARESCPSGAIDLEL